MFQFIPDCYLEPLVVCAYYSIIVDHSIQDYIKYYKLFERKLEKYQKVFSARDLCEENSYQGTVGLRVVSGDDNTKGTVIFNKSIQEFYGEVVYGSRAGGLTLPILREYYLAMLERFLSEGNKNEFKNALTTFTCHSGGYIVPVNFYINICPNFRQGLYYFLFIRGIPTAKEFLMVSEEGNIEGFTKGIGHKLRLFQKQEAKTKINIRTLSPTLGRVNEAFNMVAAHSSRGSATETDFKAKESINTKIDLEFEEAQAIYAQYMEKGEDVSFYQLGEGKRASEDQDLDRECVVYNCKIVNRLFGKILLKMFTLEMVKEQKADLSPKVSNGKVLKGIEDAVREEEYDVGMEEIMEYEGHDEKESGWIDFKRMETGTRYTENLMTSRVTTTGNGLLVKKESFQTNADVSSTRGLISPLSRKGKQGMVSLMNQKKKGVKIEFRKQTLHANKIEVVDDADNHSVARRSDHVVQLKIAQAFKRAVTMKHSAFLYKFLLIASYLIILVIFLDQIWLQINSPLSKNKARTTKDIIRIAEIRNDALVTIHRRTRNIWSFAAGIQKEQDYSYPGRSKPLLDALSSDLKQLALVNQKLINSASELENNRRKELFERDVRFFETDDKEGELGYIYMTNFQAVESIIEVALKGVTVARVNLTEAIPYLSAVMLNTLNDLLVKSEAASDIFLQFLQTTSEEIRITRGINLGVVMTFLIILLVAFGVILYIQLRKEIMNLLALLKIEESDTRLLSDRVTRFKNVLLTDTNFDQLPEIQVSEYYYSHQDSKSSENQRMGKPQVQYPNTRYIKLRYFSSFSRFFFLILSITMLASMHYTFRKQSLLTLSKALSQISYLDRAKWKINLSTSNALDLVSRNGTSHVRNILTSQAFLDGIRDLRRIRNGLLIMFQTQYYENVTSNMIIEDVLFGNSCPYISTALHRENCELFKKNATNAGIVQFLSSLESSLVSFYQNYQQSNKSGEVLSGFGWEVYNSFVTSTNFIGRLVQVISGSVNDVFENLANDSEAQNKVLTIVICIWLIVVAVLVHFGVVNRIKEADNQFREILGLFPANVVLSNFILKSYLLLTTKNVLDSVKNKL